MDKEFAELTAKYESTISNEQFIDELRKCREICSSKLDLHDATIKDEKLIGECMKRLDKCANISDELKEMKKYISIDSKNTSFESANYMQNYSCYYSIVHNGKEFHFGYSYFGDDEGKGDYNFIFNRVDIIEENGFFGKKCVTQIKKMLDLKDTTEEQLLRFLFVVCNCEFLMDDCFDSKKKEFKESSYL